LFISLRETLAGKVAQTKTFRFGANSQNTSCFAVQENHPFGTKQVSVKKSIMVLNKIIIIKSLETFAIETNLQLLKFGLSAFGLQMVLIESSNIFLDMLSMRLGRSIFSSINHSG